MATVAVTDTVTVAIPVLNGEATLGRTLDALHAQRLEHPLEVLVCDSGSRDGSVALARRHGAEVIQIAPEHFSHGGTRNLLMERAAGAYVAFLTQDALPADELWLARLLTGFGVADDVGLVFGPYRPRDDASPMVARELSEWFRSFSPDRRPRLDRLEPGEQGISARALLGARGFFTDANGCVARAAWESVPFRTVPYAEDHVLAHDMLRAGYAKVYVPDAAVIHSHEYSGLEWLRRSFDESRGLREVYGFVEPLGLKRTPLKIWGLVGADWRFARGVARDGRRPARVLASSTAHHSLRVAGAVLGSRAHRLPVALARRLSREGR
jgi:glycosyltransferase involved in cell wall biosynthesis